MTVPSAAPPPELLPGPRQIGPFSATAQIGLGRRTIALIGRRDRSEELLALRELRQGLDPDVFDSDVRAQRAFDAGPHAMDVLRIPGGAVAYSRLIAGESLATILDRAVREKKPIDLDIALAVAMAVAHRLARVQEKRFHGDLVPHHVIVGFDGAVHLIDPAPSAYRERMKAPSRMGYRSPEHVRGESVGPQADVFCLGILLFELSTATRLFGMSALREVDSAIVEGRLPRPRDIIGDAYPIELQLVLRKLLRPSPAGRFADGTAARDALRLVAAARTEITAQQIGLWLKRTFADRHAAWQAVAGDLAGPTTDQGAVPRARPRSRIERADTIPHLPFPADPTEPVIPVAHLKALVEEMGRDQDRSTAETLKPPRPKAEQATQVTKRLPIAGEEDDDDEDAQQIKAEAMAAEDAVYGEPSKNPTPTPLVDLDPDPSGTFPDGASLETDFIAGMHTDETPALIPDAIDTEIPVEPESRGASPEAGSGPRLEPTPPDAEATDEPAPEWSADAASSVFEISSTQNEAVTLDGEPPKKRAPSNVASDLLLPDPPKPPALGRPAADLTSDLLDSGSGSGLDDAPQPTERAEAPRRRDRGQGPAGAHDTVEERRDAMLASGVLAEVMKAAHPTTIDPLPAPTAAFVREPLRTGIPASNTVPGAARPDWAIREGPLEKDKPTAILWSAPRHHLESADASPFSQANVPTQIVRERMIPLAADTKPDLDLASDSSPSPQSRVPTLVVRERSSRGASPEVGSGPDRMYGGAQDVRREAPEDLGALVTEPLVHIEDSSLSGLVIPIPDDELERAARRKKIRVVAAVSAAVVFAVGGIGLVLFTILGPDIHLSAKTLGTGRNPPSPQKRPTAATASVARSAVPPTTPAKTSTAGAHALPEGDADDLKAVHISVRPKNAKIIAGGQPAANESSIEVGEDGVDLVITAPGYQEQRMTLDQDSPAQLNVLLKKKKAHPSN